MARRRRKVVTALPVEAEVSGPAITGQPPESEMAAYRSDALAVAKKVSGVRVGVGSVESAVSRGGAGGATFLAGFTCAVGIGAAGEAVAAGVAAVAPGMAGAVGVVGWAPATGWMGAEGWAVTVGAAGWEGGATVAGAGVTGLLMSGAGTAGTAGVAIPEMGAGDKSPEDWSCAQARVPAAAPKPHRAAAVHINPALAVRRWIIGPRVLRAGRDDLPRARGVPGPGSPINTGLR